MNCPHCNTFNDAANQYCMVCGKPMSLIRVQPSARSLLWIVTGRVFVMLLFLWTMRAILNGLSFIEATIIPEINLRMTTAISLLVFITVIALVVGYISAISRLWPQSFPRFQEATVIINTILYLIIFNQVFMAAQQFVPVLADGPQATSEALMLIGIGLAAFAIALVIRAFLSTYQALPRWLSSIQFSLPAAQVPQSPEENVANRN
jgi:hypothetical protein